MVTRLRCACLLIAGSAATGARADELPQVVAVEKISDAEPQFKAIEEALRAQGFAAASVRNLTVPLQTAVGEALKASPQVAIYPRAVLELAAEELRAGASREALRKRLVDEQASGGFQRRAATAKARCRNVRFDALERIASPDPHLPPEFARAHKEKLWSGVYKLSVRTDGKIDAVQVIQSIPGADQDLIDQLKQTWQFRPPAEPVCTVRDFTFQIGE